MGRQIANAFPWRRGFEQVKELRRNEDHGKRLAHGLDEGLVLGPDLSVEGENLVDLIFGRWPSVGPFHEARQNLLSVFGFVLRDFRSFEEDRLVVLRRPHFIVGGYEFDRLNDKPRLFGIR